jgi:hypothetical protein
VAAFCEHVDGSSFLRERQLNLSSELLSAFFEKVSAPWSYYFWRDFSCIFTLMNKSCRYFVHLVLTEMASDWKVIDGRKCV